MAKLKVRGEPVSDAESQLRLPGGPAPVRAAVRVSSAMRDAGPAVEDLEAVDDDLVEVELDNGLVFWTSLAQLREDAAGLRSRDADPCELPTRYPMASGSERGLTGVVINSFKFLGVDVPKDGALAAARKIESQLDGEPGFYRIDAQGRLSADAVAPGSEPVLVFIHGTASSTRAAFCRLTETPEMSVAWKHLQTHYGGRIFGFEHRTLTESPVDNAVQFLEALPSRNVPPLHLVSHSRGGLVGDLVAHGGLPSAFPESLLDAAGANDEQKKAFRRLNELLEVRAPQVARFVRVACPAGGTTLASRRLDIYLSLLIGLIGKIPVLGPFLEGLGELVAAVAKERTDPEVIPGLEAQMPNSSLIRALNGSGRELDSDLTVISGDSEGLVKNLANLFFWRANDLVVDTRSMYRGAPRRRRRWYLAEGRDVHHLNYFGRNETVGKLIAGLTRGDTDEAGFATTRPRGAVVRGSVPEGGPGEQPDRPAVVLIPGVMGSHLAVTREGRRNRVWLDLSDLMKGRFRQLAVGNAEVEVEPDAVVSRAYGAFAAFLKGEGQHVIPFPYDWRLSLESAADRLSDVLEKRLEASREPVRIVAHSMGGLVARCLIAHHSETWNRVVAGGGRLVQLGTPNGGSYLIPYLLQGKEELVRRLAAIDLRQSARDWVELIARFPGLLEMSPQTPDRDFFRVGTWKDLRVLTAPRSDDLRSAKKVIDVFAGVDLASHPVVYVAGRADETPTIRPGSADITVTPRGDGRVTWESGIPEGVDHWFVDVKHGSLADSPPAFQGLFDLATTGKTNRLSTAEPPGRRPRRGPGELRGEEVEVFPTQESLEAAALGMDEEEPWEVSLAAAPGCKVRVLHGDLAYAAHPVMVGHYAGDPIVHAEAAVDRRVGGVLSERHQLNLYPRNIGSHEIVLPKGERKGALVIGLGPVGELTPGGLSRTVEEAIVRYAHMRWDEAGAAPPTDGLGVASLLIGSGETGLSLEQVVESILFGVRIANRRLRRSSKPGEPDRGVTEVELVELYEDRALQALRILRRLAALPLEEFEVDGELVRLDGGRRRASYREPGGWWTPLVIQQDKDDPSKLAFTAHGRRARVASVPLPIQTELVDQLLRDPLASASPTHRKLTETLFELLLPQSLKNAAADRGNVLLVLDEATARFPWEMLSDRKSADQRPAGVDAGLVRQLRVDRPPEVSHPESNVALVVGDPPSALIALPGAQDEARRVADLLGSQSWTVVRQIRQDPGSEKSPGKSEIDAKSVLSTAMTGDYRIVHLAGHGFYDPDDPMASGMVVEGDPLTGVGAILFSPAEVAQMRLMPELVFINCCHLGRIEATPPHLLAANLATQFIRDGVRAVVAAGWAVDDSAALTFAGTFYTEMFAGSTFGDAVFRARQKTFEGHRDSNTWAAYQCYGDPGFRLMMDPDVRKKSAHAGDEDWVDPVEVVVELGNIKGRKGDEARDGLFNIGREVARRGWDANGEVTAGLARAFAEIHDFENAIRYYEMAQASETGAVTLKDLEQLANLRVRHAANSASDGDMARKRAVAEIEWAIRDLEALLSMAATNERYSLLGSSYKRLAVTAEKTDKSHLEKMASSYAEAAARKPEDLYATLNALSGILALGGPWSAPQKEYQGIPFATEAAFDQALAAARELASSEAEKARDFWALTYAPDSELLAALRGNDLQERLEELKGRYRRLFEKGSRREQESVLDHMEFLAKCFESGAGATDQAERLRRLAEDLRRPDPS